MDALIAVVQCCIIGMLSYEPPFPSLHKYHSVAREYRISQDSCSAVALPPCSLAYACGRCYSPAALSKISERGRFFVRGGSRILFDALAALGGAARLPAAR